MRAPLLLCLLLAATLSLAACTTPEDQITEIKGPADATGTTTQTTDALEPDADALEGEADAQAAAAPVGLESTRGITCKKINGQRVCWSR